MDEPLTKEQIDGLITRYGKMAALGDVEQGEAQRRGEVPLLTRYSSHKAATEALRSLILPDGILPSLLPSTGGHSFQQWQIQLRPMVQGGGRVATAVYSGEFPNGAWVIKRSGGKSERFADLSAAVDFLKNNPILDEPRLDKPRRASYNPLGGQQPDDL